MTINMNVETKNVVKIFSLAVAFTIGVLAVFKMFDALIMILVALFIALALNPAVNFFSKYMPGKRRGPAIAIVLLLHIVVISFLVGSLVPPVARETNTFVRTFPETFNKSFYRNEDVQQLIEKYELRDDIDRMIESSRQMAVRYSTQIVSGVGQFFASLLLVITTLVVSILMLTGGNKLLNRFADVAYRDAALRARHERVAYKMYQAVTGFVIGQVSVALVAALAALGALALLQVPYPLPLAGIVFMLGLIPMIGNTLAAILVVTAALVLKDTPSALILLAFFVIYQQIENVTLQPMVQGKTTSMPPLVVFVSVILGTALIGPIGGFFAIPAAGCVKVLLLDYFEHRDDLKVNDSPLKLASKIRHKLTGKNPQQA